jgi:hypothetical protein
VSLLSPVELPRAVRVVIDSITGRSLCCDCLVSTTGLTDLVVRSSLLTISRAFQVHTWMPCEACGAVDETYGTSTGVREAAAH